MSRHVRLSRSATPPPSEAPPIGECSTPVDSKGPGRWIYSRGTTEWSRSIARTTGITADDISRARLLRADHKAIGTVDPLSKTLCYAYFTDKPSMRWAMDWSADQGLPRTLEIQLQYVTETDGVASWTAKAGFQNKKRVPSQNAESDLIQRFLAEPFTKAKQIHRSNNVLDEKQREFMDKDITPDALEFYSLWSRNAKLRPEETIDNGKDHMAPGPSTTLAVASEHESEEETQITTVQNPLHEVTSGKEPLTQSSNDRGPIRRSQAQQTQQTPLSMTHPSPCDLGTDGDRF